MSRLSKDLVVMQALENEETMDDTILDYNTFVEMKICSKKMGIAQNMLWSKPLQRRRVTMNGDSTQTHGPFGFGR